MSDEIVGGMNLEDDGPAPEPVAAAPEPTPEPAPVEAAPPAEDDVPAVDVGGQRMVPLAEVQRLREERRALREQAAKAAEYEAKLRELEPYAQFVQNNRDLLIQRQVAPEPVKPAEPDVDPDALEAARLMDFYRADGTPDVERGARWLSLQEKRAERIAQQRLAPVLEQRQQEQAARNIQTVMQIKAPDGLTPSQEAAQAIFSAIGPELAADPRVAQLMGLMALGAEAMRRQPAKPTVAPPSTAPVVSETSGGNPRTRPVLSALEERIARERGISASKWAENVANYQPGRPAVLED